MPRLMVEYIGGAGQNEAAILYPLVHKDYLKRLPLVYRLRERSEFLSDAAMTRSNIDRYGGIDLNSANLNLQIKRDGRGVPLPLARQDMAQLSNIEGLDPVILSIKPATSVQKLLLQSAREML